MEQLKLAICGGGIASICLAHALVSKHAQWDVKIFEAGAQTREEGAAIALSSNGQAALALISPSLRAALDEAGGTPMRPATRLMMGTGPDSGRHIGDIDSTGAKIIVHRGAFWQALRQTIPDGIIEYGKKLVDIRTETASGSVQLCFEDGTTYDADAVVGCDGINSVTRQVILGREHPAAKPYYTNGYVHRVVIPLDVARGAFGESYCALQTQHGWVGAGGFMLTDLVDDGNSMQVIAGWSEREPWEHPAPFVEWPKDRLRSDLADWGYVGEAMTKVFTDQPKLFAAGTRTHRDTPTYCKGRLCLAGDAAQTFSPFQGAGASLAIEDALMLSTVLGDCSSDLDVEDAFRVYDKIRRPRRARVAELSNWAKGVLTGNHPEAGLDMQLIEKLLPNWGAEILDYDLVSEQAEALQLMSKSSVKPQQ